MRLEGGGFGEGGGGACIPGQLPKGLDQSVLLCLLLLCFLLCLLGQGLLRGRLQHLADQLAQRLQLSCRALAFSGGWLSHLALWMLGEACR